MSFRVGARADTVALVQETPFFVGVDDVVYALSGRPMRVSNHGIEERVRQNRQYGDGIAKAWSYEFDGHYFYVLSLNDQGTFVYDATTQQWGHWYVFGSTWWNLTQGARWGVRTIGINWDGTQISEAHPEVITDPGDIPIQRVLTGFYPHRDRATARNSRAQVYGGGLEIGLLPLFLTLSVSDDNGASAHSYVLELTTDPKQELYFNSLGRVGAPGRMFTLSEIGGLRRIDGLYAQIDP
jgi:hypothetical protein